MLFVAIFLAVMFGLAKLQHYVFEPIAVSMTRLTLFPFYLGECIQIIRRARTVDQTGLDQAGAGAGRPAV